MKLVKIHLISNIDMYQFVKKAVREGLRYIAQIYIKANDKYLKSCDKGKLCMLRCK